MTADLFSLVLLTQLLDGRLAAFLHGLGIPGGTAIEGLVVLLVVTGIVYLIGRVAILRGVRRVMNSRDLDRHLQVMLMKGVHVIIITVALGLGLYTSGFTVMLGALVAGLAAGGLSIGMALQGAVRNVVAGMFIYVEKPFRIGDEIEWDDNAGTVLDIQLRVTKVKSFDNRIITVPNSKLTDGITKNPVVSGPLRLEIAFPIDLKADVDEAKAIIIEVAESIDDISEAPGPEVLLVDFEDSRLQLLARFWVANENIGNRVSIRDEFATRVKRRLEEEGFELPYPHRRLSSELVPPVADASLPDPEVTEAGSTVDPSD